MKCFGGVEHMTSNSWIEFSGDPDYVAYTGIFKTNSYHCYVGAIKQILLKLSINSYEFFRGWDISVLMEKNMYYVDVVHSLQK